ncbi:MAG: S8 family serine peptidase [Planctomycetes bacterium]|nr:S8 family serine peptidase [Planctomycetota bacterium]
MTSHIARQIERIADESRKDIVSVIIQMQTKDDLQKYLQATTEALSQRRSMVTARGLVPPDRESLRFGKKGELTPAVRKLLRNSDTDASRWLLAGVLLEMLSLRALRKRGYEALEPLLTSSWLKDVAAESSRLSKFWSSSSVVMNVEKGVLAELPKLVKSVSDVYPNRNIRVPPVSRSGPDELPHVVRDNKAYTWGLSRTGAMACWGAFGAYGKGAKVAILDTGVDAKHPDLAGKVVSYAEFDIGGNRINEGADKAVDDHGHGTHCAGVVAGGNSSGRWIGMAPEARILAGRVLREGLGTDAQILAGMEWAITEGADIISMSLGGLRLTADVLDTYTRAIINANRLGIPVVVAVGNEGSQTTGAPGNDYFAFTVGATDSDDRPAGFSGGRTQIIQTSRYIEPQYLPIVYSKPEVTAPGVDIYSCVLKGRWEAWNGTSMATPHVAGAMALLVGEPSGISRVKGIQRVNLLQTLLMSTVKELGEAGQDHRYGYGRIDILRAMGYAKELGYLGA